MRFIGHDNGIARNWLWSLFIRDSLAGWRGGGHNRELLRHSLAKLLERIVRGIFHYQVGAAIFQGANAQHWQNMGVIEGRDRAHFAREELDRLLVGHAIKRHDLNRHAPAEGRRLHSLVYIAKRARTNPARHAAIAERRALQ